MITRKLTIINPSGLHLNPSGMLCLEANKYRSKITIITPKRRANAKSILNVLGACIKQFDEIELACDGEDEDKAMEVLSKMIEDGFGEIL